MERPETRTENAMRGRTRDRTHLERLANWFTVDKPELRAVIPEALVTVEKEGIAAFLERRAPSCPVEWGGSRSIPYTLDRRICRCKLRENSGVGAINREGGK